MSAFSELGPLERKIVQRYSRFFSIHEIEQTPVLQWALGALLIGLFVTFSIWVNSGAISVSTAQEGRAACWPYFQNCEGLYFLEALPYYSQTTLYSLFFGIMLLVIYFMWQKQWVYAHMGILVLYIWKAFTMFAVTAAFAGNYDYYDIIIGGVLLFFPHKEAFTKLAFVLLYFLASTIKIHEGWITASYFTSLVGGMPWFNGVLSPLAPLASNFVIVAQMVGCWFLLSRRPVVQRTAVVFFVFFHLYSITLVSYRYPATALTMLLVLFGPLYRYSPLSFGRKAAAGWFLVGLLFFFQLLPKMVPGDQKWTLEANQYGLNMFEANHQCRSQIVYEFADGKKLTSRYEPRRAWDRCNPYYQWLRIHRYCEYGGVVRARWTFDHSINGHPFYRIVDAEDACQLTYKPLSHNPWIITPKEGAPPIGRPLKNPYDLAR